MAAAGLTLSTGFFSGHLDVANRMCMHHAGSVLAPKIALPDILKASIPGRGTTSLGARK